MEYNPRVFAPDHVQEIFSEVLFANRTMSRGLVRPFADIKHSLAITTLTGDIELGARIDHVTDAVWQARANNLKFSDATLTPKQLMALEKFNMNDLRNTRFAKNMAKGARNVEANDFETAVLDYTLPRIGKSYERRMHSGITADTQQLIAASNAALLTPAHKAWAAAQTPGLVDGFGAMLLLWIVKGAPVICVAGTTLTATNCYDEHMKIIAAAPAEVASNPDNVLFVPVSDRILILQYNQNQQYRDKYTVTGLGTESERVELLGVVIEFVETQGRNGGAATGVPLRYMGRAGGSGDFGFGTDLTSDQNTAQIEKVNTFSTDIGMRMDMTLDTAVLLPQQKVIYL
jgi:hypothetical protein